MTKVDLTYKVKYLAGGDVRRMLVECFEYCRKNVGEMNVRWRYEYNGSAPHRYDRTLVFIFADQEDAINFKLIYG